MKNAAIEIIAVAITIIRMGFKESLHFVTQ
jgi:hypothetical protein